MKRIAVATCRIPKKKTSTVMLHRLSFINTAVNGLADGWLVVERTKTRLQKFRAQTDIGSCRYFNARHAMHFFRCDFFATWNLRPNLPAESKITKAFQTNFLLMCMSDTQTRTYQKSSDREALSSSKLTTKSYCCGAYLSVNHSKSSSTPRGVG